MRIQTNTLPVQFVSLFNAPAESFKLKTTKEETTGKTTTKTSPDGRNLYRTDLKAVALDEQGQPIREEQNVTLAVIEPTAVTASIPMKATGKIWVTHYITNNNRIGVSIIAERLEPVTSNNNNGGTK